jgi:hypothetical protein
MWPPDEFCYYRQARLGLHIPAGVQNGFLYYDYYDYYDDEPGTSAGSIFQ